MAVVVHRRRRGHRRLYKSARAAIKGAPMYPVKPLMRTTLTHKFWTKMPPKATGWSTIFLHFNAIWNVLYRGTANGSNVDATSPPLDQQYPDWYKVFNNMYFNMRQLGMRWKVTFYNDIFPTATTLFVGVGSCGTIAFNTADDFPFKDFYKAINWKGTRVRMLRGVNQTSSQAVSTVITGSCTSYGIHTEDPMDDRFLSPCPTAGLPSNNGTDFTNAGIGTTPIGCVCLFAYSPYYVSANIVFPHILVELEHDILFSLPRSRQ